MSFRSIVFTLILGSLLTPTYVFGQEEGLASYYHKRFHGKKNASGEVHNGEDFVAAHKTHPFGTYLRITNLSNMKSAIVCVTDRGPFRKGRIVDVSSVVAEELGFKQKGIAKVRVEEVPAEYDLRWLDLLSADYLFINVTKQHPIPPYSITSLIFKD